MSKRKRQWNVTSIFINRKSGVLHPYVQIERHIIDDKRLTFAAKGLLVWLIAHGGGLHHVKDLELYVVDPTVQPIRPIILQLERLGYIETMEED